MGGVNGGWVEWVWERMGCCVRVMGVREGGGRQEGGGRRTEGREGDIEMDWSIAVCNKGVSSRMVTGIARRLFRR